jgi:hypothetical protein
VADLIVNDLSLDGQYASPEAFWTDFEPILKFRQRVSVIGSDLLCSTGLRSRRVSASASLLEAIHARSGPERFLALRWITKGPFWEHSRQFVPVDVFEYRQIDVTEQGLGETARRRLAGQNDVSVSFLGVEIFEASPLEITHLREDASIGSLWVPNVWKLAAIEDTAKVVRTLTSGGHWRGVIDEAAVRYDQLVIARVSITEQLRPYPYDPYIAQRIIGLLGVLQQIAVNRLSDGDGSPAVTRLLNLYFVGREAQFSDESETNKRTFRHQMTFTDPLDENQLLFCSWHGKVRTDLPYRIHFEWPIPKGQSKVKVTYIGPKLTRS